MKINLITPDQYKVLFDAFDNYPNLTLQNKGYETLDPDKLTEADKDKFREVTNILQGAVVGFQSFQNFRIDRDGRAVIRLQYDWFADTEPLGFSYNPHFIGVGYVLIDDLSDPS